MHTISFISANYVARALEYSGPHEWGTNDEATIQAASAEHFETVADDIANAGFQAVDIWTAHCHWQHHGEQHREQVKDICARRGLAVSSYAGGLQIDGAADLDAPFAFMQRLGAPLFAGGINGLPDNELAAAVNDVCEKYDMRWGFENHPQKTADEILSKIGHGRYDRCGVALDTGWCATQGLDALEAAKRLRDYLFILHLKDVEAVGGHDTCALGEGVVPVENVVRYLVESGWQGTICIEHEPYDRDPMPEVRRSLERLQQWLR